MGRSVLIRWALVFWLAWPLWVVWATAHAAPDTPDKARNGPFGLSQISTSDGKPAAIDQFLSSDTCGVCHEREYQEFQGSLHSAAHGEPLYRGLAELARKEAGDAIYAVCSGCHSSAGVVAGLIPGQQDADLPEEAKSGVSCDACHQISSLTGEKGRWGEPGNASFVLTPGRVKYGDSGKVAENRAHTGEKRDFFARAEYCASCHTVIHPINGLRIETTYDEWKSSVYAEKGIVCQDCHMRTVEEAMQVAETLKPVVVKGPRAVEMPERDIFRHYFVGGNANAGQLTGSTSHGEMAQARLKGAARLELTVPKRAVPGREMALEVAVRNVAAGHSIPTGVTELRQVWIDLQIQDGRGKTIYHSGQLDQQGELPANALWFGAVAVDAAGKPTVRPWEMVRMAYKKLIPPKGTVRETLAPQLPGDLSGPITINVRLLYRSAPPSAAALALGEKAFPLKIVEMATAKATVLVAP